MKKKHNEPCNSQKTVDKSEMIIEGDNNKTTINKGIRISKKLVISLSLGGLTLVGVGSGVGYAIEHTQNQDKIHKQELKQGKETQKMISIKQIVSSKKLAAEDKIIMLNYVLQIKENLTEEVLQAAMNISKEEPITYQDGYTIVDALKRLKETFIKLGHPDKAAQIQKRIEELGGK